MKRKMETLQGIVTGFNTLQCDGRLINCWENDLDDHKVRKPLNLSSYIKEVVEVKGYLGDDLWKVNPKCVKKYDKGKEASSLDDLMLIRAANSKLIDEKVKKSLGTALGYKWSKKENTKHPCILIFVKKKYPGREFLKKI